MNGPHRIRELYQYTLSPKGQKEIEDGDAVIRPSARWRHSVHECITYLDYLILRAVVDTLIEDYSDMWSTENYVSTMNL